MKNIRNKRVLLFCLFSGALLSSCSDEEPSDVALSQSGTSGQEVTSAMTTEEKQKVIQNRSDISAAFKKDYTRAMRAFMKKDYELATEELKKAVKEENQEQLNLAFYRVKSAPYFPHFYLGKIAFLSGDCKSALEHWDTSLAQGVIRETPNYAFIEESTKTCESGK